MADMPCVKGKIARRFGSFRIRQRHNPDASAEAPSKLVVAQVKRLWVVGHLTEDPVPTRYFPEGVYSASFATYIRALEEPQELIFRLGGKNLIRGFKVNKIGKKGVYLKTYYDPASDALTDRMTWPGWYVKYIWL